MHTGLLLLQILLQDLTVVKATLPPLPPVRDFVTSHEPLPSTGMGSGKPTQIYPEFEKKKKTLKENGNKQCFLVRITAL